MSCTISYVFLHLCVAQWALAQINALQTGDEGATSDVQDTYPHNYYYGAVFNEKIRYDVQYQIHYDAQAMDLRELIDYPDELALLLPRLTTCTGPACAGKDGTGDVYSVYGINTKYCYSVADRRYWNTTKEPTLTTVTSFITQTPPPATSTAYVTSLSSKRLWFDREPFAATGGLPSCCVKLYTNPVFQTWRSWKLEANGLNDGNSFLLQTASSYEAPFTSTQNTATNPIPKPTSPEPTSTTPSNSTNSEQGNDDSFWTRIGGIISIVSLAISSILGFIAVVYAIKTFYKR